MTNFYNHYYNHIQKNAFFKHFPNKISCRLFFEILEACCNLKQGHVTSVFLLRGFGHGWDIIISIFVLRSSDTLEIWWCLHLCWGGYVYNWAMYDAGVNMNGSLIWDILMSIPEWDICSFKYRLKICCQKKIESESFFNFLSRVE